VADAVKAAIKENPSTAGPLPASETRVRAMDGLLEVLRGWREDLKAGWEKPPRIRRMLENLATHPAFSYLRDPALASRVPEAERPALRDLQAEWKRVAERVASRRPAK